MPRRFVLTSDQEADCVTIVLNPPPDRLSCLHSSILDHICTFLSLPDLMALASVNRHFRDHIARDQIDKIVTATRKTWGDIHAFTHLVCKNQVRILRAYLDQVNIPVIYIHKALPHTVTKHKNDMVDLLLTKSNIVPKASSTMFTIRDHCATQCDSVKCVYTYIAATSYLADVFNSTTLPIGEILKIAAVADNLTVFKSIATKYPECVTYTHLRHAVKGRAVNVTTYLCKQHGFRITDNTLSNAINAFEATIPVSLSQYVAFVRKNKFVNKLNSHFLQGLILRTSFSWTYYLSECHQKADIEDVVKTAHMNMSTKMFNRFFRAQLAIPNCFAVMKAIETSPNIVYKPWMPNWIQRHPRDWDRFPEIHDILHNKYIMQTRRTPLPNLKKAPTILGDNILPTGRIPVHTFHP